jgi:hypothetical protein
MQGQTGTQQRFKTGDQCTTSGGYAFDGYTDGSSWPAPRAEEMKIPVSRGERFPPIRSAGKACFWRMISRL